MNFEARERYGNETYSVALHDDCSLYVSASEWGGVRVSVQSERNGSSFKLEPATARLLAAELLAAADSLNPLKVAA